MSDFSLATKSNELFNVSLSDWSNIPSWNTPHIVVSRLLTALSTSFISDCNSFLVTVTLLLPIVSIDC